MQKIFLAFLFLSCILRLVYFSAWAGDSSRKGRCIAFIHKGNSWTNYISSLPATLFMTGSSVLVYTFSSLYHSIILNSSTFHATRHIGLSLTLVLLNIALYVLTIGNYVKYVQKEPSKILQEIYVYVLTAAVTVSASMFLVYGFLLFNYVENLLRPTPDEVIAEAELDQDDPMFANPLDVIDDPRYVNPEMYPHDEPPKRPNEKMQRRNSLSPGYMYASGPAAAAAAAVSASGIARTMSPIHNPQPRSPRANGSRALDHARSSGPFMPIVHPNPSNMEPLMVSHESLASMQVTIDMSSSMMPPELEGTAKLVHDSEIHSNLSTDVTNLFIQPSQHIFPDSGNSTLLMDPLKDVEIEQVALAQLPLAMMDDEESPSNLFRDTSRQWSQGSLKQHVLRSPSLKGDRSFGSGGRYQQVPGSPTTPRGTSSPMVLGNDSRRSSTQPRQKSPMPSMSPRHEARLKNNQRNSHKAESTSKNKSSPAIRRRSGTNVDITPLMVTQDTEQKPRKNESAYGAIAQSSGSDDLFAHSEHGSLDNDERRMRLPNPMLKILKLGVICGACMVIRIVLLIIMNSLFDEKPPLISGFYYLLTEFLPSNAMILVLDTPTTQVALGRATLTSTAQPSHFRDNDTWKSLSNGSIASVDLSDVPSI